MDEVLSKANVLIRSKRPSDAASKIITTYRRNNFLQLTFQTGGCRYSLAGSCSMCNFGQGNPVRAQIIMADLEEVCNSKDFTECNMLLLGASGSFLDEYEIPEELQYDILRRVCQSHIEEIFIETHYQSVTDKKLDNIRSLLPDKCVHIEMGLETITKNLQNRILNKDIPLIELKKVIRLIHKHQFFVSLNVLLGMPFLTQAQKIEDTRKTIHWAIENGADYVVIFPINIQPYTLFQWWYKHELISPPSLWLLFLLLLQLPDNELQHICLAWYGNRCISYTPEIKTMEPQSCPKCRPKLLSFFDDFASDFNVKSRKEKLWRLDETFFSCNCRKNLWMDLKKDDTKACSGNWEQAYRAAERLVCEHAVNGGYSYEKKYPKI